ncbi:ParB/RepB/Spo0J family partition protein [Deltaproteobacteria bacterium]|nr:ParB/RepB/Spo0J family partition protein [Deltaproteobacteria bacterium]
MDIRKVINRVPVLMDLKEFDETPGPNCMSYGFEIKPLIDSMKATGLINPPLVARNREGRFDIVAGYRRIMALKSMGSENAPCMDLSDSGFSYLELLLINLYDNIPHRRFNEVEKGMIINRLMLHMSGRDIEKHYMRLLNIRNRKDIDMLKEIDEFNKTTKDSIASGAISMKTIGLVLELDKSSRAVILKWILNLRLNFNQQLKYIDYINDISIKENKSASDIIKEEQFLSIWEDRELNTPQKSKKILELLSYRRFPLLTRSEKNFAKNIAKLNLPNIVSIWHSPFFEAQDYRLEIVFKDGMELKKTIDHLACVENLKNAGDAWREDL